MKGALNGGKSIGEMFASSNRAPDSSKGNDGELFRARQLFLKDKMGRMNESRSKDLLRLLSLVHTGSTPGWRQLHGFTLGQHRLKDVQGCVTPQQLFCGI